jgi:protoporphyrinogen oxidase
MADRKVINQVVNDLHRLRIIDRTKISFSKLRRTKYAYVMCDLDYQKHISLIKAYTTKLGIDLLGRFGEFRYLNMDACVRKVLDYLIENRYLKNSDIFWDEN